MKYELDSFSNRPKCRLTTFPTTTLLKKVRTATTLSRQQMSKISKMSSRNHKNKKRNKIGNRSKFRPNRPTLTSTEVPKFRRCRQDSFRQFRLLRSRHKLRHPSKSSRRKLRHPSKSLRRKFRHPSKTSRRPSEFDRRRREFFQVRPVRSQSSSFRSSRSADRSGFILFQNLHLNHWNY